jgi:hypothetical protein
LELTIRCGDVTLQSLTLRCFGAWSLTSHCKYFALYESQHMGHFLFAYLPTSRCYYPLLEASSFQDLASDPLWLFWLLSYGRSKYLTHFFSGAVVKPTTGWLWIMGQLAHFKAAIGSFGAVARWPRWQATTLRDGFIIYIYAMRSKCLFV